MSGALVAHGVLQVLSLLLLLLPGVATLGLQHGPCAFTSEGEWEHCCCDRATLCWSAVSGNFAKCCEDVYTKCPAGSPVLNDEEPPRYVGQGGQSGMALYEFADKTQTTLKEVLDCEHQWHWRQFRKRLALHPRDKLPHTVPEDVQLHKMAKELVMFDQLHRAPDEATRDGKIAELSLRHFELLGAYYLADNYVHHPERQWCFWGYISASFVLAVATQNRSELAHAQLLLTLHHLQELDISSSTSWPIGYWDVALNLGSRRPRRVTTLAAFEAEGRLHPMRVQPVMIPAGSESVLQEGRAQKASWGMSEVRVTAIVHHPSLDIEIPTFLLRYFPDHLRITFAFLQMGSSYTGGSLRSHICNSWPQYCASPHAAATVDEQQKGAGPPADLLVCSWYLYCHILEEWTGRKLPLISYYGGFPVNSFFVRSGHHTVVQELKPMHTYLKRTTALEPSAPALLLSDGPFTSEFLHAYTGVRIPVHRPFACYVSAKYTPSLEEVLILRSKSSSGTSSSAWMYNMLMSFAGRGFRPSFTLQPYSFLSFEQIASYKAIAYVPGPHSWILMQWREMYSMNMPLFVPRREDLMLQSNSWHRKLLNNLEDVPDENWVPERHHWANDHPFSPFPPRDPEKAEYVLANMYWSQWLEYFKWPHVTTFSGLPHLLQLVVSVDFSAISAKMSEFNRASLWTAMGFWRDALPGLLQGLSRSK